MPDYLPNSLLKSLRADDFASQADADLASFKPPPAAPPPEPTPTPEPVQQQSQAPAQPSFSLPTWDALKLGGERAAGAIGAAVQEKANEFKLPDWSTFKLGGEAPASTGGAPPSGSPPQETAGAGFAAPAPAVGGVQPDTSSPDAFLGSVTPSARAAARAAGLPDWAGDIAAGIASNETGYGKAVAGNNFFGIKGSNPRTGANTGPVGTWEVTNGQRVNTQDTFRAYGSPQESFDDFFTFLKDNPRYAQALQAQDPTSFIKSIHAAGYATDPNWSDQVLSIAGKAGQTAGTAPTARTAALQTSAAVDQAALDDPDKWALCGPVAAVLAATAHGADWTVAQAKGIASKLGLWDAGAGMHGLQSEVQLLQQAGVAATTGQADEQRLAQEAQNGNTPIVSTDGHYFVLQGYDAATGKFDTGSTGTVYRGGSRWLSLADMQNLAGTIQGAAYMDNPASPNPSVVASKGQGLAGPQALERSGADTSPQPGDLSPTADAPTFWTPPGNPDQPSGLSAAPATSETPTFPSPPAVPASLQPQASANQPGMQADSPNPAYVPANLPTPPTPLYQEDPNTPQGVGSYPLNDAVGGLVQAGHQGAVGLIDEFAGARQAREAWDRQAEIDNWARENGYELGALDPRFQREHPDLADELTQTMQVLAMGVSGGGPEISGVRPAHLGGPGAAPLPAPLQRAGEVLTGLRDAAGAMTRRPPGGAPAGVVGDSGNLGGMSEQPRLLTPEEFRNLDFGVPEGGSSITPKKAFDWRQQGEQFETIHDLANQDDRYRVLEALGKGWPDLGPNSIPLLPKLRRDEPITIYRARPSEDVAAGAILPGSYVTESKWYAQHHGEGILGGDYKIAEMQVRPSELMTYGDPHEFIYVPHDVNEAHGRYVAQVTGADPALAVEADRLTRGGGGAAPSGPAAGVVPSDRYYHGTGSAFDTPNPARFDENGLFGPGYYLTSDPRVAGSGEVARPGYAEQRWSGGLDALQRDADALRTQIADAATSAQDRAYYQSALNAAEQNIAREKANPSGPNVRAVDVPRGLRILNIDGPLAIPDKNAIAQGLSREEGSNRLTDTARGFLRQLSNYDANPRPGNDAYGWLLDHFDGDRSRINQFLSSAGFDGIRYDGGQRIPMQDAAGQDITHQAVAIFDSSLPKITNATSGRPGGLLPSPDNQTARLAGQALSGAVSGGYAASQEPDASPGSVAAGALAGAGRNVVGGALGRRGVQQGLARAVERASEAQPLERGASTWATSISDPNKRYDFHYEVRPLYDLTTSHTDAITPHPDFPAELQPRLRDRAASRDQINRIAGQLAPDELLAETHRIDSGPPIIGPDGVVESGNGRTMALRLAQQRYPERFTAYQDALRSQAANLGIDPTTLDTTPNPVLVRVRDSAVDRPKFAAEANQGTVMEMGSFETALQDAKRLSPDTLAGLDVGESQSIDQALLSASNRDIVRGIVASIPANERAGVMAADGSLSQAGLQRIKAALFASTYPGESGQRLARVFFESPDPNIRNIQNGVMQSLPAMARAEGLIKNGERSAELSLSDDLAKAVDVFDRLKGQGMTVPEYLAQSTMFARELTPLQESLLGHLDSLSRSPRRIRDFIQRYADGVEAQPMEGQGGLFGDVPTRSKEDLLAQASGGALDVREPTAEVAGTAPAGSVVAGAGQGGVSAPPSGPAAAPARLPAETRAARTERRAESAAVGQEAGAASAAAQSDPYTHAVGTGYTTGASPETQAQLARATGQREFGTVTREESHAAGTALALDQRSMDALDQRINREGATRVGAAEADALRERAVGAIQNVQSLQDDVYRLQRQAEEGGAPDVIDQLHAVEKLLTAARDSAALSLTSGRRYAEAAGRTLAQFQYRISAQAAQKVAARIEQLSTLANSARLAVDVKPGRKLSPRAIDDLERLGQQLPQDGDLLRNGSAPVQAVGEKIKQAARENGRPMPEDKPLAEQLGALEREHAAAHGDQAKQTEIGTRREALLEQIRTEAEARAQTIADAQGKDPKNLTPEEVERAINQAVGAPTVTTLQGEALAAERARRGSDAVQDPIRAAVDQFRTGERTAVTDDRTIAKHWLEQAVQFPDDMGIRQAAHDAIDTIATHGLKGQRLAETVRKSLEIRLGKSYDNLMAGVKARNDAATLAQIKAQDRGNAQLMAGVERRNQEQIIHYAAQFDRLHIQELTGDIRDFVAAARTNPDMLAIKDAFGESRIQRLQGDLALVNQTGTEKASAIRQQMFKAGILHLAQKSAKDMVPDEMDGLVRALGNVKTPEDLATLVRAIRQPRLLDYLYEVQYVNMLSSPVTHITNATANTAQLAGRLAFNPLTVAGDVLLNPSSERATTAAEIPAAFRGAARGLREGVQGAAEVMKTGQRPGSSQQAIELGNLSGMNREFLTERFGSLGAALHMVSSRPLEAMDVLLGHMAYASAVEQGATREAAKLLRAGDVSVKGMSVQKAAGVVMGNIWDHAGVLEEAGKVRDYTLLRGSGSNPLERWLRQGAALRNAPADAGFARQALAFVGNQALPFFGVPLNYAKQGLERSVGAPVNTVRMALEQDPAVRAELFKKAVVGYGIMGTAMVLAAGDNLTGDGPKDPAQRDLWLADHQPNSVRLPGTKDWHSWQSTPWGMPFAIVANTKEAVDEAQTQAGKKALPAFETGSAIVQGGLRGAASGIMNQTFLQNLGQMYGQFTGTQDAFPPLVAGTASRFIQPAMVRWFARITDGMERDATHGQTTGEQIGQRLASGYPGARETLPERQNVLGQPEPNQSAGPKGVLPLAFQGRTGVAPGNATVQAFRGEGISIPRPASDIALGQGVKVPLSPAEQRQWSAARGPVLQDLTQKALANPKWASFTPEQRTAVLKDILNSAHDVANSQIIKAIGGADEVRRRIAKAS